MKYLNFIKTYKYQIAIIGLFVLGAIIIHLFVQGLRKDHSLDMVKQEIKLKEEARLQIEKERSAWREMETNLNRTIYQLQVRDSLLLISINTIDNKLKSLPAKYNEATNKITNYGSTDLYNYFSNLPTANDY